MNVEAAGAAALALMLLTTVLTACLGDEGRRSSARRVLAMLLSREARKNTEHNSVSALPTETTSVTTTVVKTKSTTVTKVRTKAAPASAKKGAGQ